MSNFTLVDLIHISCTLIVWCLASIGQGLVIGYISNVLNFRDRSLPQKLGLSIILSAAIIPSLYYLLALLGGLKLGMALNACFLLLLIIIGFTHQERKLFLAKLFSKELIDYRFILSAIVVWLVLALVVTLDWHIGDQLYLSMPAYDHAGKIAIADSIGRTGIPPSNPMFFPGQPVPLYYYYYWPLTCTVISNICGSLCNTRDTVLAGILWTGCVFIATIALACSYFKSINSSARKVAGFAIALLLVSNWYIMIVLPGNINALLNHQPLAFLNINWVGEDQISTFIPVMIWVPHHIAGLLAGLLGSILILEAPKLVTRKEKIWHIVLAGICLASNFGLSIYTAMGFAFTWIIWAIVSLYKKRFDYFGTTFSASVIALLLSLPFIIEQAKAHHAAVPLEFSVRKFEVIDFAIPALLQAPDWLHQLAYFVALPFNYLFGFGFILIGALSYWENKKYYEQNFAENKDLFLIIMTGVGLIFGSFVRTNIQANDFGWRIIMLPGFAFLLWSAQYLTQQCQGKKWPKLSKSNWLFIALGFSTLIYGLFLDRIAPIYSAQTPSGEESLAYRSIYQDIDSKLSYQAIVQHNPIANFWDNEPFFCHYSHRQAVASDEHHGWLMGPTYKEYMGVWQKIKMLFEDPMLSQAISTCRQYKINVIVIKDTDKIWSNKSSWLQHFPVIAENAYARAFLVMPEKTKL